MDNNVEGGIHRPPRFCTLASAPAAAGVAAPAAVGVAPAAYPAPAVEEHHTRSRRAAITTRTTTRRMRTSRLSKNF